jgi:hypothetical protein
MALNRYVKRNSVPQTPRPRLSNRAVMIVSTLAAVFGLALTSAGLIGGAPLRALAGDPEPLPESTGTVATNPTEPVQSPTQPLATSTSPATAIATNTSLPTNTPLATNTPLPTNTPLATDTPAATTTPLPTNTPPAATSTAVPAASTAVPATTSGTQGGSNQPNAAVLGLPSTGAGGDNGGTGHGWLFVAAGVLLSGAGLFGLSRSRRQA